MRQYAVIGNPISHSKSPILHNTLFQTLKFPAFYGRYLLTKEEKLAEKIRTLRLSGANITVPFKEAAFRQCDEVRGIAKQIGSVNTIVQEDGRLIGYNTDANGFFSTLKREPRRVLILGAGGTSRAISAILNEHKIPFLVLNRSKARLESFRTLGYKTATHEEFSARFLEDEFDLVINSTSAGLDDNELPLPRELLMLLFKRGRGADAYDVIYGKQTPFLKLANELGAKISDGRMMLLEQAAIASHYFINGAESIMKIREIMLRVYSA
ncbi:MAG: shikimate dehydrogenase [Wolinella sp.]